MVAGRDGDGGGGARLSAAAVGSAVGDEDGGARLSAAGGAAGACAVVASPRVSFGGRMMGGRSSPAMAFLLFFRRPGGDVASALIRGVEEDWPRRLVLLVVAVASGLGVVGFEKKEGDGGQAKETV